jgi:hypothetical protein
MLPLVLLLLLAGVWVCRYRQAVFIQAPGFMVLWPTLILPLIKVLSTLVEPRLVTRRVGPRVCGRDLLLLLLLLPGAAVLLLLGVSVLLLLRGCDVHG